MHISCQENHFKKTYCLIFGNCRVVDKSINKLTFFFVTIYFVWWKTAFMSSFAQFKRDFIMLGERERRYWTQWKVKKRWLHQKKWRDTIILDSRRMKWQEIDDVVDTPKHNVFSTLDENFDVKRLSSKWPSLSFAMKQKYGSNCVDSSSNCWPNSPFF